MSRVKTIVANIGFALSYWIFDDSYRFYRFQKKTFNGIFRSQTPIMEPPVYKPGDVGLQGFRHSGNSFLTSNFSKQDRAKLAKQLHRVWIVTKSLDAHLPTLILIREPRDVALSTFFRTSEITNAHQPFLLFPATVLLAWIGYHRRIVRLRGKITIISLEMIQRDYATCRRLISDAVGLTLAESPGWSCRNAHDWADRPVKLSWLSRFLLRFADRQYRLLVDGFAVPDPAPHVAHYEQLSTTR